MSPMRPLVIVLAGGAGGRLELLTRHRAKPAVPFAGTHRLIDFPMSNCANSRLDDVWVSQQFNPISLSDHLSNGRPWDLDRTIGGLLALQPRLGHDERTGFVRGTADALWRYGELIRDFRADAIVVVSADAVYALDYGTLVDEHMESGSDATIVTTEVAPADASRYGVVEADGERVTGYEYKPEDPAGSLIANEVFCFRARALLDTLEELAGEAGEEGLHDLGHELLPRLVAAGRVREHRFDGYWRDVGTIPAYWEAHQDLLRDPPPLDLDDLDWPILTRGAGRRSAARILASAEVSDSLLSPGTLVAGTVERSVVGRGARVEAGAVVRDSILLPGAIVRSGAVVVRAVLDDDVQVSDGAEVGEEGGELAVVGDRAVVSEGRRVPAGGRLPEVED